MLKILLSGCNGKMGKMVEKLVNASDDTRICCGTDLNILSGSFPVYSSFDKVAEKPDVVIDFSHPSTLPFLLEYVTKNKIPAVIATTGFSDDQIKLIKEASEKTAIFFTFNMTLGINLLASLLKKCASVLGNGYDIEIIEKHHNQKVDAPSGTAIMLANAISSSLPYTPEYVYDRHNVSEKRKKQEIGIHTVRGGTIVGEHEVIFAGTDEVITLSHSASSKEVFAAGAVNAARFIVNKSAGLYNMEDLVEDR